MSKRADCVIALRSDGVSLVLDVSAGQLPAIVHWGADLGTLELADVQALILANIDPGGASVVDEPFRLAVLPEHWTGWVGRPGLSGSRAGRAWSPKFTASEVRINGNPVSGTEERATVINVGLASVAVDAVDEVAQLQVQITIELTAGGLIRACANVINNSDDPYTVNDCVVAFPIPNMPGRSWISPATGARNGYRSGARWGLGSICARGGRVAPERTQRPCCMLECRGSLSPKGKSGRYTLDGAETTLTMRSGSSPAPR